VCVCMCAYGPVGGGEGVCVSLGSEGWEFCVEVGISFLQSLL
jgi:hypothetical protein